MNWHEYPHWNLCLQNQGNIISEDLRFQTFTTVHTGPPPPPPPRYERSIKQLSGYYSQCNLVPRPSLLFLPCRRGERPWLRLVTCLLDFSRFQRNDWREGQESKSLSRLSPPTEPSREWNCNLKLNVAWSAGKTFLFLEKMSTRNLQPTPKMISKSSVTIDLFTAGCVENLGTDPGLKLQTHNLLYSWKCYRIPFVQQSR